MPGQRAPVVGAAILRDGRVLAARRTRPAAAAGRWELPGGKVEQSETPADAVVREVAEELGCTIEVEGWLAGSSPIGHTLELTIARASLVTGRPVPHEHDEVRWLAADELDEVDWLDSNRPFLAELRGILDGCRLHLRLGTMTHTPDQRLLLVHAHPDDESIGQGATMARYVGEDRGVTLVTCTAGEMGEVLVPELEHLAADRAGGLGEHRRGELERAMKELGVTDHRFLGGFGHFRDSGMKWHEDGHAVAADETDQRAFANADLTDAASLLVEVIREVRPQVLVTYDEFGGYGHPDHIQAHRVAMYAATLAAVPSFRRDLGEAWEISKIYWGAMSESRMRAGLRRLRDAGDTTTFEGMDPDGPLPRFAVRDDDLTTAVDGGPYVDHKMAAMRAHATQITVDGPFFALSNNVGESVWATEFYRLAKGRPGEHGSEGVETDLFAGL